MLLWEGSCSLQLKPQHYLAIFIWQLSLFEAITMFKVAKEYKIP